MTNRMVRRGIGIFLLAVALLICGFFLLGGKIGVSKSHLAENLRTSQNIPNDWLVTGSVSDTAAIYLFYPPDKSCYGYTLYVNHPGLSFGYIFRGSTIVAGVHGTQAELPTVVQALALDGSEQCAYFSLNFAQVQRAEIDNGQTAKTYLLDSSFPFTILLPQNNGEVTFYDKNGAPVEIQPAQL